MSQFPLWYVKGTHAAPALPTGWDALSLGGLVLNAKALVTGLDVTLKIDPRKKKGANAAHPTSHGLDVSEGSARLVVWTQEMMDDVDDALPLLMPPLNLLPLPIDHPQLRSLIRILGKIDVLVKGGTAWQPSSVVHHGWEMHLKLLHWPAAAKGASTAKSNTPDRPANKLVAASEAAARVSQFVANPLPTAASKNFAPPDYAAGAF